MSAEPLEGEIVLADQRENPRNGGESASTGGGQLDALVAAWLGTYTNSSATATSFAASLGAPPYIRSQLPGGPTNPAPADDTTWLGWCAQAGVDPLAPRPHHINLWLAHTAHAVKTGRFSRGTRVYRWRAMSLFLGWCVEYQHIPPLWLPGEHERKRHGITGTQTNETVVLPGAGAALLWAAEHDNRPLPAKTRRSSVTPEQRRLRSVAIVSLILGSGLRVSELTSANYRAYWRTPDGGGVIRIVGKGGKPADQPVAEWAADALDTYLDGGRIGSSGATVEVYTRTRGGDVPLITSDQGQRLNRHNVAGLLSRLAVLPQADSGDPVERQHADVLAQLPRDSKGRPRIAPHALRHDFAHQVLSSGGTAEDVRNLLRHANIKTSQVYMQSRGNPATSIATRLPKPGSGHSGREGGA